jgi:hypothetical protein
MVGQDVGIMVRHDNKLEAPRGQKQEGVKPKVGNPNYPSGTGRKSGKGRGNTPK